MGAFYLPCNGRRAIIHYDLLIPGKGGDFSGKKKKGCPFILFWFSFLVGISVATKRLHSHLTLNTLVWNPIFKKL